MAGRRFAVFDVDGTIVRTALFLQVVDELIARGTLDNKLRGLLDAKLEAYRTRSSHDAFNDYNENAVNALFNNLDGLAVDDYRQAVNAVIERSRNQIYVYTRDLIGQLKAEGYFLIALSGSEKYAVERFTGHYGFDVVLGDEYLEQASHFTGEIDSIFADKGAALERIVREHGLDYTASIAVGDSAGDAKMLALVEQPIAFNPEAKLLAIAQEHDWLIVIERKNVIYRLEPHDGRYVLA